MATAFAFSPFSLHFRTALQAKFDELPGLQKEIRAIVDDADFDSKDAATLRKGARAARQLSQKVSSALKVVQKQASLWQQAISEIVDEQEARDEHALFEKFLENPHKGTIRNPVAITSWQIEATDLLSHFCAEVETEIATREMEAIKSEERATQQRLADIRIKAAEESPSEHSRRSHDSSRDSSSDGEGERYARRRQKLPQLPPVKLPTFDGKSDWALFWEQFESRVDKRRDLADITKLQYLESSLEGEAKKVFSLLAKRGAAYPVAKKQLQEEYGREDEVKRRLLQEWRALKCKSEQLHDQLHMAREAETLIAQLTVMTVNADGNSVPAQGGPGDSPYDSFLYEEMLSRFSAFIQRHIRKAMKAAKEAGHPFTLSQMLKSAKQKCRDELELKELLPSGKKDKEKEKEKNTMSVIGG